MTAAERYVEIDWLKAISVAAVVWIHCIPNFFATDLSWLDQWFQHVTRFAVPGFLLASGFLYAASARAGAPPLVRRLRRLLVPYIVFSLVAVAFRLFYPVPAYALPERPVWEQLLTGSAMGTYYYVFVFFWLILLAPLVARIPRRRLGLVVLLALCLQWAIESQVIFYAFPFWSIRDPARWMGSFLVGWWLFGQRDRILAALGDRALAWSGAALVVCGGLAFALTHTWSVAVLGTLEFMQIYATLALIGCAASAIGRVPLAVRWVSDASYSIYLSQLFFVEPVLAEIERVPGEFNWLRALAAWTAGLGGGGALAGAARALFGERRARALLG